MAHGCFSMGLTRRRLWDHHGIPAWFGTEGTGRTLLFQAPCNGQGCQLQTGLPGSRAAWLGALPGLSSIPMLCGSWVQCMSRTLCCCWRLGVIFIPASAAQERSLCWWGGQRSQRLAVSRRDVCFLTVLDPHKPLDKHMGFLGKEENKKMEKTPFGLDLDTA